MHPYPIQCQYHCPEKGRIIMYVINLKYIFIYICQNIKDIHIIYYDNSVLVKKKLHVYFLRNLTVLVLFYERRLDSVSKLRKESKSIPIANCNIKGYVNLS